MSLIFPEHLMVVWLNDLIEVHTATSATFVYTCVVVKCSCVRAKSETAGLVGTDVKIMFSHLT